MRFDKIIYLGYSIRGNIKYMPGTLHDIAKATGFSITTVSLVLNGKDGISQETRNKVMQAAETLNYKPKKPQNTMPELQDRTIQFLKIAMHGHTVNRDHNLFISDYIDGMFKEAQRQGYKLEIANITGQGMESIIQYLLARNPEGAILLGTEFSRHDIMMLKSLDSCPIVVLDTDYDGIDMNFVDMNNFDSVFKITEYLVSSGFRKIGFVNSNVQTRNFQLRKKAFLESMQALEQHVDADYIVDIDSTITGAYIDMMQVLANGAKLPECYICVNDIVSYGCIKALKEKGLRIPEDISIVGFDNLPMSASMEPPLTTIDVSKQKMGHHALALLDELIHSHDKNVVKILVGSDLILRKSVLPRV